VRGLIVRGGFRDYRFHSRLTESPFAHCLNCFGHIAAIPEFLIRAVPDFNLMILIRFAFETGASDFSFSIYFVAKLKN
jgi:hypothetical protein